jgi:hypothetical protein
MAARSPPWRAQSNRSSNVRDAENGPGLFISKGPEMRPAYPKLKCLLGADAVEKVVLAGSWWPVAVPIIVLSGVDRLRLEALS